MILDSKPAPIGGQQAREQVFSTCLHVGLGAWDSRHMRACSRTRRAAFRARVAIGKLTTVERIRLQIRVNPEPEFVNCKKIHSPEG